MDFFGYQELSSSLPRYSVEVVDLALLTVSEVDAWRTLADEALSFNPFSEPDFVLPLVEHLQLKGVGVLRVRDQEEKWLFACPVVQHWLERGNPVSKFRSLRSKYTFLDHPLVSSSDPVLVLTCLFEALSNQRQWHGLGVQVNSSLSDLTELMDFVSVACGGECILGEKKLRPIVSPVSKADLLTQCSKSRRKSLNKAWRKFEQLGEVEFRLVSDQQECEVAREHFIQLEAAGWKGEGQTSLNSDPGDLSFFHEICDRFAGNGRLLFGEIVLNEEVVASTCNLRSGNCLFGFKIGWDQNYAAYSLGYWSEILLADSVSRQYPEISLINSCSSEDSYVGKVWPEREEISSRLYLWSRRARIIQNAKSVAKAIVKR